jgi:prolipoprotein diacylglyceryl transferase
LLFVSGLVLGYFVAKRIVQKDGVSNDNTDKLLMYVVIGTSVGARLGHVLFYGPYWDYVDANNQLNRGYFSHPEDIIKIWEGGLASHGAALALLIALYIYSRRVVHMPYLWILDRVSAPIAIGSAFIRLGNLVNHEMVGHITNVPWAFRFLHNDCPFPYECTWNMIPPRHPAQLYEAICYFITFGLLMFLYWKKDLGKKQGVLFGVFLTMVFGARFIVEFFKEGQTERDDWMLFNTGQMLSVPLILAGLIILWRALKSPKVEQA